MSDPHAHHDNPGSDHGHGGGHAPAPAQPPMVAYLTPAPAWPQGPAYAPAPTLGHCCCSGPTPTILQAWPASGGFMVCCRICGLAKDEHDKHGHDQHKTEPPPEFSDVAPGDFRARFKDVWNAVQENRIPAGIIADCHALLLILLHGLDGKGAKQTKAAAPSGFFRSSAPSQGEPLARIKDLVKDGKLLNPLVKAAEGIRLSPGDLDMDPLGDPERARRYMNLIWQIADQGYEQVRWSERGESPPRAKAPEPDPHGHGHGP